jgi:hypothetical protein
MSYAESMQKKGAPKYSQLCCWQFHVNDGLKEKVQLCILKCDEGWSC